MGAIQVDQAHYFNRKYLSQDRWVNYWYQLDAVLISEARTILEIGVGNRLVSDTLKKFSRSVTTLDIDPALKPDVVGSVLQLPFSDDSFDFVLAAEVLEHLPWDDFPRALAEIRRVTKRHALITLPHSGYVFSFSIKLPLLPRIGICWKLPHFWKRHQFNGEHYWELGKQSYPVSRVMQEFKKAGFSIAGKALHADDPAHYHFLLEKQASTR